MATAPLRCDLIIHNALLLTLDAETRIIADGGVAISAGRISAVASSAELRARYQSDHVIDARERLLMPGFVNVHNHTPLMITRGMVEDLNFAPAYTPAVPQGGALSFEQALALSRLGMYELLRAGNTTIVDYYRYPQACAAAAEEIGLRAVIGGRISDADMQALASGRFEHKTELGEMTLRENQDLIEAYDGRADGRIRCEYAPHAADTCSPDLLRQIAALAARHGHNVHTHLAQSQAEVDYVRARDGIGPTELLDEVGLLNDRLIAAHCIFLSDSDITRAGRAGISVAHAPVGNAASGNIAPTLALQRAGARITLCTDSKSADPFEAMRMALAAARIRDRGSHYEPKAPQVLRWAIHNGAAALGLENDIGSIEPGKQADLILLDRRLPNLAPIIDGHGIVVHSASAGNVTDVLVAGRVLLRDGRAVNFDGAAIVHDAQRVAERLWQRYGTLPVTLHSLA